jgi:tRNA G18 (ribose-2'-O)-methylase SpoU
MLHRIADALDERLAPYRTVGDPAALEGAGLFVAEGRLVVERLVEDGRFEIHSIVVTPPAAAALDAVLARTSVPVYLCAPATLEAITGFNFHRGCLALAYRGARPAAAGLLPLTEPGDATRVLALEGVTNPDNVGGLFRAALAFGVDAVIHDSTTADPLYRKAIRTSMGAALRVPFLRVDPWVDGLASLGASGLRVIALTPDPGAMSLEEYAARRDDRIVLVVGSEGFGMRRESLACADVKVRIAVDPRADSLNVVTAAAIALHALGDLR